MTSLIPMIDVWPGLYLWYSYSAYNRTVFEFIFQISFFNKYTLLVTEISLD